MDFVREFLGGPFYFVGNTIWNVMLSLIGVTAGQTPMSFSELTWTYITTEIYPWSFMIGTTLLNLFFFIGFVRQINNFRQNFTMEILVEACIRLLFANGLMVAAVLIMSEIFQMAGILAGGLLLDDSLTFVQNNIDAGSVLAFTSMFGLLWGIIYLVVCIVCSFMIFLTVYGRFLQLYLLVVTGPLALPTLPGGSGLSQTAYSWIKTFLSKTFEIFIIALSIVIAAKMCNELTFGQMEGIGSYFDGGLQTIQNMATMVLLTASVKGTDSFMRRVFAL